jgi:hypothetical protein
MVKVFLLTMALLFICCSVCCADALQVTATMGVTTATPGQVVPVAINLKNILSPRTPIIITAEITWENEYGISQSTSASATLNVVQPIKINRYKVAIPALFAFVADSAKLDGQPVTITSESGLLTFELNKTINENEQVTLNYSLKAQ